MSLPANYLAVEPLMIARIVDRIGLESGGGDLAVIGGLAEYDAALENDGPYPGAFVLLAEDDVDPAGHSGRRFMVTQRWQVALLTRPEITPATGAASLAGAGALLSQLIDALAGWTPAAGYQALRRVPPRAQSVAYANGLALFVLDFEVAIPVSMGVAP